MRAANVDVNILLYDRMTVFIKIIIREWVEETISGTIEITELELGILLDRLKKDDVLICSELSRL